MNEEAINAAYPASPPLQPGAPTPEQLAEIAVLGKTVAPASPSASPAPVAEGNPVASAAVATAPTAEEVPPSSSAAESVVVPASPTPVAPYTLPIPDGIPLETVNEDNQAILTAFAGVAAGAGIAEDVAEGLLQNYVQAQGIFDYGNGQDQDAYTHEDAARVLERFWGPEYAKNLAEVRATAKSLGPAFLDFLDTSGMGNSPPALVALLNLSVLKLDPKAAKAELERVMSTEDYRRGSKASMLRVHALSRRAHK